MQSLKLPTIFFTCKTFLIAGYTNHIMTQTINVICNRRKNRFSSKKILKLYLEKGNNIDIYGDHQLKECDISIALNQLA